MLHALPALILGLCAQDATDIKSDVDAAVDKGARWLSELAKDDRKSDVWEFRTHSLHGLAACALLAAGADPSEKGLASAIENMKSEPWKHSYDVAARACAFALLLERNPEDADSFIHLAMTMKFFVESQNNDGSWGYGYGYLPGGGGEKPYEDRSASSTIIGAQTQAITRALAAFGKGVQDRLKDAKKNVKKLAEGAYSIHLKRDGTCRPKLNSGDFSNSQFAALALIAAAKAKLRLSPTVNARLFLPGETVQRALAGCWIQYQNSDGGWGYYSSEFPNPYATSYGSMTCGGAFALQALAQLDPSVDRKTLSRTDADKLKRALDRVPRAVENALRWIEINFDPASNPCVQNSWKDESATLHAYYGLFSLERAADIGRRGKIGKLDWYAEGARHLLKSQSEDGGWPAETVTKAEAAESRRDTNRRILSTCYAILFLRRTTSRIAPPDTPTKSAGGKR